MHIDLDTYDGASELATEICVIGSGAAGITMTRRLLQRGHSVTLLESGGIDYEPATASLNAGTNLGDEYYDLEDARLRFFGGTSAIWGGRIAQLEPMDLQHRSWVPHSGWPIQWQDLERYYPQARRAFGISEQMLSARELDMSGVTLPEFDPSKLEFGIWDFDSRFNRFQFKSCDDLFLDPLCTVFTHATATALMLNPQGNAVDTVTVRSLAGRSINLAASVIVLAAGGIENARLLLASRSVAPNGVGNDHDLVGRYFMEHPHARGGHVTGHAAWMLLNAFGRRHRVRKREVAALIKPSPVEQEKRAILNTSVTITARQPASAKQTLGMRLYSNLKHSVAPTQRGRALWMSTKKFANWAQHISDPLRPWLLYKLGRRQIALLIRAEQAPNPQSRVVLTDQRDALGMPRIALDWHLSSLDIHSVGGLVDLLDQELRRLGLGRAISAEWLRTGVSWQTDPLVSAHPIGGYHHMGTTRMSDNPRDGVTDASGKVHGVANLYVTGSSLFPTSGWANPTLTIVALALRSADRISTRLHHSKAA